MGGFPSGQRGQTVNLLQIASVVRIHLRPYAAVAELADAQDLKSCGTYTPVPVRFRFAALRRILEKGFFFLLIVFMIFNIIMSGLALSRYSVRKTEGTEASTEIEYFLDEHFTDERMERIYPNAIIVE